MASSSSSSSEPTQLAANTLIYYKKPVIGDESDRDALPPLQVIFPTGGFAIAVPVKKARVDSEQRRSDKGIVASAPNNTVTDYEERLGLRVAVVLLGVLNIVVTALLFQHAHLVDISAVEEPHSGLPLPFDTISTERRPVEKLNFAFILAILSVGVASAIVENSTGLSIYCLGTVANFFLSTYSLPYFVFSFRFILDIIMLFVGLVLRSRYMYSFLPLRLQHRG